MEAARRTGPGRVRKGLALAAALAIGGAGFPLGFSVFMLNLPLSIDIAILQLGSWGMVVAASALVGLAFREWILHGKGDVRPVLRSPRGWRGAATWALGSLVGAGPIAAFLWLPLARDTAKWGGPVVAQIWIVMVFVAPTLGLIATRALCRRWGAPRPPASHAAESNPAPAVVEPSADPPSPSLAVAESAGRRRLRAWLALAAALGVGAAGWPMSYLILAIVEPDSASLILSVTMIGAGAFALAGLALRERLLRVDGQPPVVLRSPRGFRSIGAFAAGYLVGVGPPVVLGLLAFLRRGELTWAHAGPSSVYVLVGPTLGLIVTRALCRRWGTPAPPASPAAAPLPAPAVERPADDSGPALLPATA